DGHRANLASSELRTARDLLSSRADMRKDGRSRSATTTLLSPLSMLFVLLAVGSGARGQELVASPSPSGFDRRHRVGVQIGGTGALQVVYRYRAAGPLHLEAGALAADHGGNLSAGFLLGAPVANRWFPYLGFGGGWLYAFGPKRPDGCDPMAMDCPL